MALPVFILAAGLGTRLRPLTDWLPKPLLPVGDRPALAHILDRVRPVAGSIVANAHHRAPDLRAFLETSAPDVHLSEEVRILGTAGGLAAASHLLGPGDVLVWNGDILASLDPFLLLEAHARKPSREATLAIRNLPKGQGNVGIDRDGRIVRLRTETMSRAEEVSGGAFLGVHIVGETLRGTLPSEGCLVGDVYLPALRQGRTLRAFGVGDIAWHDIGTLADYTSANAAWLDQCVQPSYLDPSATVSGAVRVERSIVGRDARVEGEGALADCIVWPDARATAPLEKTVVTPWGVVDLG
jgi:mannose-1-phosphate guanylyltransferase